MAQNLNLLDASFKRKRQWIGSAGAALVLAALAGGVAAVALVLQTMSSQSDLHADQLARELASLQTQLAGLGSNLPSADADELARLRNVEAGQRQVRAALDSGLAGARQGYSEYLLALSRQTRPALWLTGFNVAADGRSLQIAGRMTDPRQLPEYLRRLNAEPLFKGREFAQLSLKTATGTDAATQPDNAAEFALRTVAVAGPGEAAR